ncbi:MAG TPA: RNA polymerase sigma-70 factor [Gemmatimonadales bacterium]|jgi:RNA polymerase sigma-70 factor (ECF subfamily)
MASSPGFHQQTAQFLARIRAGDRDAFEQFFREWYPRLADYAQRLLQNRDASEDAVQDVFVALWSRRDRLPEGDRLAGYLYRSVRNRALNQLRRQRTAGKWLAVLDPDPAVPPDAETGIEDRELDQAYRAALAELSPRGREVFLLSRDQGLSYPQIADALGISIKTVETLMGRALRALRGRLLPRLDHPG